MSDEVSNTRTFDVRLKGSAGLQLKLFLSFQVIDRANDGTQTNYYLDHRSLDANCC